MTVLTVSKVESSPKPLDPARWCNSQALASASRPIASVSQSDRPVVAVLIGSKHHLIDTIFGAKKVQVFSTWKKLAPDSCTKILYAVWVHFFY